MGIISTVMNALFGGRRNVVAETAEVFRENAENAAQREVDLRAAAMAQFGAEFQPKRGWFDQLIDGLNRLPRPALAYGTIGLFVAAMHDPVWFASRMQGVALVPEPLWWLMGAIVSFYFGARHQAHTQAFQRSIADSLAMLPQATAPVVQPAAPPQAAALIAQMPDRFETGPNAALREWWSTQL